MSKPGIGLLGRKVGMTQVFQPDGTMVPVSVVAVTPNTVTLLRTPERDGYTAVQVGAGTARKLTKPRLGQLKGLPRVRDVREFVVDDDTAYEVGQTLDVSLFEAGESVDITGVSKGKGFSGTIKRHHFKRGPETHGSDSHRQPGSIGGGTTPGKVFKGTPMAGHMGNDRITVKGATILRVDAGARAPARQGSGPRRTQRAHPGQEGLAMSVTTTLYTKAGAEAGTVDLPEALFAAPVNTAVLHQAVVAQLAGRRTGTADTKTRGEVRGGGQQAVPPEGHRPRAPGHALGSALSRAAAWSSVRTRGPTSSGCPSG